MTVVETCPGCGLALPVVDGPNHPYLGASASCWKLYGEVLAREFADPELFAAIHQATVDAYAVQHPGQPGRRSIQSVAVHLMMLTLWFDRQVDVRQGPALRRRMVSRPEHVWLDPPQPNGSLTIADVAQTQTSNQHQAIVWAWARDVWQAWKAHQRIINRWLEQALGP